jgi:hypothetical protein
MVLLCLILLGPGKGFSACLPTEAVPEPQLLTRGPRKPIRVYSFDLGRNEARLWLHCFRLVDQ